MAKKKEQPAEEGAPAWMSTFSDLMNLLLCFFVLLFASSTMDEGKIQKIASSFDSMSIKILDNQESSIVTGDMMNGGVTQVPDVDGLLTEVGDDFSYQEGDVEDPQSDVGPMKPIPDNATESDATPGGDPQHISDEDLIEEYGNRAEKETAEMYDEIITMAESSSIESDITFNYTEEYVELELSGSILFDTARAELRDDSKFFLQKVARILTKYKNNIIEIEGHTDNVPIHNANFENNRQLSTERARSVYEYIIVQENFIDSNIIISGYGDSRPAASNATEEGRARNRRVVIKIYNKKFSNR